MKTDLRDKVVLGIVGMPGAGKATVASFICKAGCDVVVMGDEVRAEAERRNLEPTPENIGRVMLQIRAEEGPGVLAKRCIPKILASKSRLVVIDGIRSPAEAEVFKRRFPNFKLLAVHSSPRTRFNRLLKRGRSDDPKDWETFIQRDRRELSVGIGEVIATADYMIVNEGTKSQLRRNVHEVLRRIMEDLAHG